MEIPKSFFEEGDETYFDYGRQTARDGDVELKVTKYYYKYYYNRLVHGTTLHGTQLKDSDKIMKASFLLSLGQDPITAAATTLGMEELWQFPGRDPLTYYHRTGPVGGIFRAFDERNRRNPKANTDVAIIGLGTGSSTAYGKPGQKLTIFEIDPQVVKIAEDPKYFTFLSSAKEQQVDYKIILGDARLKLEEVEQKYGVMLVDAFSSDSIPVHLLTREALKLYLDHLEDDGLLGIHISNRYLDLEPVVMRLAADAKIYARVMHDRDDRDTGKTASTWIVLSKTKASFGEEILIGKFDPPHPVIAALASTAAGDYSSKWRSLAAPKDFPKAPWTDDFSDMWSVINFRKDLYTFFGLLSKEESEADPEYEYLIDP
jgi:hypothetical protein